MIASGRGTYDPSQAGLGGHSGIFRGLRRGRVLGRFGVRAGGVRGGGPAHARVDRVGGGGARWIPSARLLHRADDSAQRRHSEPGPLSHDRADLLGRRPHRDHRHQGRRTDEAAIARRRVRQSVLDRHVGVPRDRCLLRRHAIRRPRHARPRLPRVRQGRRTDRGARRPGGRLRGHPGRRELRGLRHGSGRRVRLRHLGAGPDRRPGHGARGQLLPGVAACIPRGR